MKQFFCIVFIIALISCDQRHKTTSSLTQFIPRKASVILKTNNLKNLSATLKNNDLIQTYKGTSYSDYFKNNASLFNQINPNDETLLCYTKIGSDYELTLLAHSKAGVFAPDSTAFTQMKLKTTTPAITKFTSLEQSFYTIEIDGVFMASTSQLLLENALREKESNPLAQDKDFIKAYNAASTGSTASILVKGSEADALWSNLLPKTTKNPLQNTFSWTLADLDLEQNDIHLSGVTLVKDSVGQRLELLKNTKPQVNKLDQITPIVARGMTSLTYDDWNIYKNNLADFRRIDPSKFDLKEQELFATFNEVGVIQLTNGAVIAAQGIDAELTETALAGHKEKVTTYRQIAIYAFGATEAFTKAFTPILNLPSVKRYCILGDFYIFANSQEQLETIIANYQNKATLSQNRAYSNTKSQLSSASSMLFVSNTAALKYDTLVTEQDANALKKVALDAYPFAAVQLVQDAGFMHMNAVINKNKNPQADGAITQIASVKLDASIALEPQLVKNHRTKGMDVVIQDENNNLYLVSNSGKILWQKTLDGKIIGPVQQVDLYRNGRLQLAFVTQNTFYILDRNGKEVAPFPIAFTEAITQPLAIFDYENNRNYRFVITQTDAVKMYDKAAKVVSGFSFTKAESEVIFPPKHIRISNKDYITIAENSGKLNILSRTGKSRITVSEKINFGDTPIQKSGSNFVTYDVNGEKTVIATSGKVTQNATNFGSGGAVLFDRKYAICLRENKLYINNKVVTLDYGSYTEPTLFTTSKNTYVSVTNTETSEVSVFNGSGTLQKSFPVYGVTQADIGFLERNKSLGFVTQGDRQTLLIYRIN